MSIRFWEKGGMFPTLLKDKNLRIFFATDLYIDVPFKSTPKDFAINNRIPMSDISLLCENPDGDIIVSWFNGEARIFDTSYNDKFRMVGITKFDVNKIIEEHFNVLKVGSTKFYKKGEIRVSRSDIFYTRYYMFKNDFRYMILDTSDGRAPVIIDTEKNGWLLDEVLKGSKGDPLLVRDNGTFADYTTGMFIVDPIEIPQPINNPRLVRRL